MLNFGLSNVLWRVQGLGKTLQGITLLWTMLNSGHELLGNPIAKRIIIVCPTSLVNNWDAECTKWLQVSSLTARPAALRLHVGHQPHSMRPCAASCSSKSWQCAGPHADDAATERSIIGRGCNHDQALQVTRESFQGEHDRPAAPESSHRFL